MAPSQEECKSYKEDGVALLAEEEWTLQPPPTPRAARLSPALRVALAGVLLALLGIVAVAPMRAVQPAQVRAGLPLVSLEEEGEGSGAEDGDTSGAEEGKSSNAAFGEAVAHTTWDSKGHSGCIDVDKGELYWVLKPHESGWTWATTHNGTEKGFIPEWAIFRANRTMMQKGYESKNFTVRSGETVWAVDAPNAKCNKQWTYIFYDGKMGWVPTPNLAKQDAAHHAACFVHKSYTPTDKAHLELKKGEVVWKAGSTHHSHKWILVENKDKKQGYVPRDHLIETKPLPILTEFTKDSKCDNAPKPLLYVGESDTVWVDDSKTKGHWVYVYLKDKEGYVPDWALMKVVGAEQAEEEDKEPSKDAAETDSKDDSKDDAKDDSKDDSKDASKDDSGDGK